MKKRNVFKVLILVFILALLFIPITNKLDNGNVEYKAILYKYTKIHEKTDQSATGYIDGYRLEILGHFVDGIENIAVAVEPK